MRDQGAKVAGPWLVTVGLWTGALQTCGIRRKLLAGVEHEIGLLTGVRKEEKPSRSEMPESVRTRDEAGGISGRYVLGLLYGLELIFSWYF